MEIHVTEERTPLIPDILAPGLTVIFVGAAPSHTSAEIGHYYAGPTNRFWLLLHQSGFTPRRLLPVEDSEVLRHGIGLMGMFKELSSSANHLLPPPDPERRRLLIEKITALKPAFICYNGKDVYRMCTGRLHCDWGEQPTQLGDSRQYVAISSSARADAWAADRLAQYRELRQLCADI